MADDSTPDDPFLERRLATLAALPVPERPTVDELRARGGEVDPSVASDPIAGRSQRRAHRIWVLSAAAAVVVVVLVAVALVARGGSAGVADGGVGESLAGREFWSVSVTEDGIEKELANNTGGTDRVYLRFSHDRPALGVEAGCNMLNADFRIDGDALIIDQMGTTQMGCFGAIADRDEWIGAIFRSSPTIVLEGDRLTITSGTTVIELLDRQEADPDRPLAGTVWLLDSVVRGESVMSAPSSGAWMQLTDDGTTAWRITGNDGCNGFSGTIEVVGDRIGPLEAVSTSAACPGMYDEDPDPVIVFDGGATYEIDGSELRIMKGDRGLIYRGSDPGPTPTTATTSTTMTVPTVTERESITGLDAMAALAGPRWELEAVVLDGTRTEVDGSTAAPAAWLQFRTDSERFTAVLDGGARCGEFTADVVVLEATITFGPVEATRGRAACPT